MDKQIHELTNTATDFAADDYIAVDNATDQTRKMAQSVLKSKMRDFTLGDIHNLPTTITVFRTGDVIPVDGPSGTAKMSKDDLLKETAENALGSIHSLSDTANEADLVAGNFLAIDVPGVGGSTKKLPGEIFKGIGQIKKNIIDYLPNQVSVVSSTDLQSIENTNVLAGFEELVVETTASSYCGVEIYIRNFVVGKSFICGVSRDVGNTNVFRVRFYDAGGNIISSHINVDGTETSYTIPTGTDYINITLMACWGTPLGANTQVTFSDFLVEYEIEKKVTDFMAEFKSDISASHVTIALDNANFTKIYNNVLTADKIELTCDGTSYCGAEFFVYDVPKQRDFVCEYNATGGNSTTNVRVLAYDKNDQQVGGTYANLFSIPDGTSYLKITIMACWGTALPANTKVTFSAISMYYTSISDKDVAAYNSKFKSSFTLQNVTMSSNGIDDMRWENNVLRATSITLKTNGNAYCGADIRVDNVPKSSNLYISYTTSNGNATTNILLNFYDSSDNLLYQTFGSYGTRVVIPARTAYYTVRLMACWGTALAANTNVIFYNLDLHYTSAADAYDLVVGGGTFKYYGVSRPIFKQAEVLGCTKSNVLNKTKVTGDPSNWVGAQSMAIYGGYAFSFSDGTACTVIDLSDNSIVDVITMPVTSHYAGASFTDTFVDAADDFPLIAMELGTADGEVGFFRIQNSGGTWSATLYKKVSIDDNSYKTHGGVASYDIVSKRLYVQAFTKGGWNVQTDNPVKFFRTPEIDLSSQTTQEIDEVEVIGYLPFYVIQDAKVVGDLWLLASQAVGAGSWWKAKFPNSYSNTIIILDKSELSIRNVIYTRTQEPEGIDVVDNKIYLSSRNTSAVENAECFWIDTFEV